MYGVTHDLAEQGLVMVVGIEQVGNVPVWPTVNHTSYTDLGCQMGLSAIRV